MKFFHLSDLHIGLKLVGRDLREDQEYILGQIVELAAREQPDAVVIAGDVYDKAVPSGEAVEVLDGFIARLTETLPQGELLVISGNHDSAQRLNCFRSILSRQRVHMAGMPPQREGEYLEQVTLTDAFGPVHFYLLPFVKPSMMRELVGTDDHGNTLSYDETVRRLLAREKIRIQERNVLVSHQFYLPPGKRAEEVERMDSEVLTIGNIDQVSGAVLEPFDYAALGHIHKPMEVGGSRFRYCGTPLACSVSEAGQQKGVILVEMGPKGDVKTQVLPLHPLRQVRVLQGTLEELLGQACGDYVTAILTDPARAKKEGNAAETATAGKMPAEAEAGAAADSLEDAQDRLRAAFPYLLEIRRENLRQADYSRGVGARQVLDPFDLCCTFLPDLDEQEREILRDVLRTVQEGGGL